MITWLLQKHGVYKGKLLGLFLFQNQNVYVQQFNKWEHVNVYSSSGISIFHITVTHVKIIKIKENVLHSLHITSYPVFLFAPTLRARHYVSTVYISELAKRGATQLFPCVI